MVRAVADCFSLVGFVEFHGIRSDRLYSLCLTKEEWVLNALRDCDWGMRVWQKLLHPLFLAECLQSSSSSDWADDNLSHIWGHRSFALE